MPKRTSHKKKRRIVSKTALIHGEGNGEYFFLTHLKGLYSYSTNLRSKITGGSGGTVERIVRHAIRALGDYDRKVVIADNDKPKVEMENARILAANNNIELIEHTPCLEMILLSVLGEKGLKGKTSSALKSDFEKKFIPKKRRSEKVLYQKHFPKELLDKKRKVITGLDRLIRLFENNKRS